ncbi:hypothetical protein [Bacillus sp. JCM 19041]
MKKLLKEIANKVGADVYFGREKMASFVDNEQGRRTVLRGRRLAIDG